MTDVWPWAALAGLGIYHGLNPAMGWLFAVALGLHRHSRGVVIHSLIPIALGHALAIAIVAAMVATLGVVVDTGFIRRAGGVLLVAWGGYHLLFGSRHRVWVGMKVGFAGLAFWSFMMATAHGAGLMLVPVLIPLCLAETAASEMTVGGSLVLSLVAVGVHTLAMLAATGAIAIVVFEWVGVAVLRRGWFNLDLLWSIALVGTGILLLVS